MSLRDRSVPPPAPRSAWLGRVARGFVALVCGQGIRTFGHLLLVPLYLAYWSPATYGEWLALVSLTTYLAALDLGVSTAGANRLTQEYARGDLEAYRRYQASALAFYGVIAVAGSALLALAAWQLPVARWLGLHTVAPSSASWVVWLIGVQVLLAMPVGFLVAIFRSTGRMAWSEWLGNTRALAALASVPLVLALGGGMPALAAAQLVPLVAVAAIALWSVRARWPELLPRPSAARGAALRALMAPSLLFALFTLANALALQGAVLLIVAQLGGAAVAVFVTSRTLTNLLRQAVFTANNALWPHLTAMEAAGDLARLRAVHRLLVAGSAALSIAFAAALWQVGPEVLEAWTGGALAADVGLLRLLLVQMVLQAPWVASSVVPLAVNRPRPVALCTAAASALGLGVAAALIGHLGAVAVPIGLIAGELVACAVLVPRAACRLVGEDYPRFALRQWRAVAVGAGVAFAAAWAAAGVAAGPAPLRWMEIGAVALVTSATAAWAVGLHGTDRAALSRRARASLARLSRAGRLAAA